MSATAAMGRFSGGSLPAEDPERVLERVKTLHPVLIDLSLGRIERLMGALGDPHRRLPPTIHVAGTNGKGSTTAFLRAIAEGAGLTVHATISPHLVSVTERFVVGGRTIDADALAAILAEIERLNEGKPITVFEVLIGCAFLLFERHPAELVVLETGLGGRFDATNLIRPVCCAITSISLDHEAFLGDTIEAIAFEKAGIIKQAVPVVTGRQAEPVLRVLDEVAATQRTRVHARGREWSIEHHAEGLRFADDAGELDLPLPSLIGTHQIDNVGVAVASIRASRLPVASDAFAAVGRTRWAGRLERLEGRLAQTLPRGFELWLDGGHNPGAGQAIAAQLAQWSDRPLHLVIGMKLSKDVRGFLGPILPFAELVFAVEEPDQEAAVPVEDLVQASAGRALPGPRLEAALAAVGRGRPGRVLICGSLHLAGIVLRMDRGHA